MYTRCLAGVPFHEYEMIMRVMTMMATEQLRIDFTGGKAKVTTCSKNGRTLIFEFNSETNSTHALFM